MIELGQLERRYGDFANRNARVIAVSVEGTDDAGKTQDQFPHLTVLSDPGLGLSEAAGLIHAHAGPSGEDIDTPTTIVVDRDGTVRWIYRPQGVFTRLSPDEVLAAVDGHVR